MTDKRDTPPAETGRCSPHQHEWRESDQYGTLKCNVCGVLETQLPDYRGDTGPVGATPGADWIRKAAYRITARLPNRDNELNRVGAVEEILRKEFAPAQSLSSPTQPHVDVNHNSNETGNLTGKGESFGRSVTSGSPVQPVGSKEQK